MCYSYVQFITKLFIITKLSLAFFLDYIRICGYSNFVMVSIKDILLIFSEETMLLEEV